ncbi:PaREP1 family protein [Acidianus sp. HS-5]|uniref:PaREP1 family protein n=1 Tax=Acidianus sp. HS-5 TaxID=2886040 RepID=UPI001F27E1AA|nr:PaREP1 family protein [Acidianus sp. HS-5]BDC18505.1 hypothetical protein HS5_13950 [Acidianus sp. HS-5]
MVQELQFDPIAYKRTRLQEAKYEAEIARKFLEQNLIRNAAGKAFQAWKALVAALAVDRRSDLEKLYPGYVKIKGNKTVKKVDWIILIMPTTLLKEVAMVINDEINNFTNMALLLHQYQYNGPDKEGIASFYRSDEMAKQDILRLLREIDKLTSM